MSTAVINKWWMKTSEPTLTPTKRVIVRKARDPKPVRTLLHKRLCSACQGHGEWGASGSKCNRCAGSGWEP